MEMLGQSGVLTLLGMGVVFGFLIILVIVISQVGRFISSREPDNTTAAVPAAQTAVSVPANVENSVQIIAAISTAVNEYRKSH
jgi:oxaloacetate decarboxylase gamma subunit